MSNPVLRVQQTRHGTTGEALGRYCWVWCPGCDYQHAFVIANEDGTVPSGPVWTWDGNLDRPAFSPSAAGPRDPRPFAPVSFLRPRWPLGVPGRLWPPPRRPDRRHGAAAGLAEPMSAYRLLVAAWQLALLTARPKPTVHRWTHHTPEATP